MSLYGDIALVAAPHSWVVHAYRFNGTEWIQDATLGPNEAFDRSGYWGTTVSIWGDCALIGSRGKAYVFRRAGTEWTEEAELGPSGRGHAHFGMSVSLYERTALIGDHQKYDWFPGKGCAYVFRYDGTQWTNEEVLRAPDGRSGDLFGDSVSLSRDVCIIGARYHPPTESFGEGAAYIFRHDGKQWALEQKLRSPDDDVGDFGSNTRIDGDNAIVGDEYYGSRRFGSAYIYEWSGEKWVQVCRFAASDAAPFDHFGGAVSIGGGYVAAGAPNNECNGACYGAVYVRKIPTQD